ncbi:MAG: hypothetical protein JEZ11_10865 [Desulfobacterales bacterium]|nr:hypothetical protein [Desulfobacterales bacterium]
MTPSTQSPTTPTDEVECFGEFNPERTLCKKFCALNIRCAIEKDMNVRMEILDELVSGEAIPIKIQ